MESVPGTLTPSGVLARALAAPGQSQSAAPARTKRTDLAIKL